ncbi:MAG: sister chromatid cohesion protein PDS5, partial [Planctomycetota bacterium]|nr:sister chromatid cohesion protein PDS5 [Planctomycetota bacterium]
MKRMVWTIGSLALAWGTVSAGGSDAAAVEKYDTRAAAVRADDAPGQYRLALWCTASGRDKLATRHYRAVVTVEPDHRAARRALGFEQVRGRWVKGKEARRAKGFVEYRGTWVTPAEYALYNKDEIAAKAARKMRAVADAALKRLHNADASVRARAMAAIEALPDAHRLRPLAIAARVRHEDVRRRAIRGLGALNVADALPPLYKRAIFDP